MHEIAHSLGNVSVCRDFNKMVDIRIKVKVGAKLSCDKESDFEIF